MNFKRLVCILFLAVKVLNFTVERKPEMKREVEVGTVYEQNIPILFTNFQHTSMEQFKKKDQSEILKKNLCRIKVAEQGSLAQRSALSYRLGEFKNVSEQYYLDRIIYTLKDLQYLRAFIDAIFFQGSLVALFNRNEVIVYEVGLKEGQVSEKYRFQINQKYDLSNAQFVANNRTLLLVSSKLAFTVSLDGAIGEVSLFTGNREELTLVRQIRGDVFLGLGEQGLAKYKYSASTGLLSLQYSTLVLYKSNNSDVYFDVDQFQIDPATQQLYILDYSEGILEVNLSQIKSGNTTISSKAIKLVSGCRNLVLLSTRIFLTCPQITQIQRSTGRIIRTIHNSFSPYLLQFHDQRLYLYGRKEFGVYDLFGKTLAEYTLKVHSQLSMVVSGFLITFSSFGLVSQYIIAQQQALYCFSSDSDDVGMYTGVMQTQGVCKEYYGSRLQNVRSDELCFIDYPFQMQIKDTYRLDLTIQIILVVVWLGISAIFAAVMAVKNYWVHRAYGVLNQQQYKQLEEVSNNPSVEQKKIQQVVIQS